MKDLERILGEILRQEKEGKEQDILKKMVLEIISKEEVEKENKKNGTNVLSKRILKYLKNVKSGNEVFKKANFRNGCFEICNGFSAYIFNPDIKIEGLQLVGKDEEYIDLDNIFKKDYQLKILEEKIDMEVLKEKIALFKANKKKIARENVYFVNGKAFDPLYIQEVIDLLGKDLIIKDVEDSDSFAPIYFEGKNGKSLLLPVRLGD